jgi:hypothetical protein
MRKYVNVDRLIDSSMFTPRAMINEATLRLETQFKLNYHVYFSGANFMHSRWCLRLRCILHSSTPSQPASSSLTFCTARSGTDAHLSICTPAEQKRVTSTSSTR